MSRRVERPTVFPAFKDTARITRFYERLGYRPWSVQFFR